MFYFSSHVKALKYRLIAITWYKYFMGNIGKHTIIASPVKIKNPKTINIGNNVYIDSHAWLYGEKTGISKLNIDSGTQIGRFFHCVAYKNVEIQKNVLIAERVFISDCNHGYYDILSPILSQQIYHISNVVIGSDTWIGEGVSIIGASIGKHCVIGANAVVTSDIEDYCVAVGNPARIIKKYNKKTDAWEKINDS
ncbi:acyltransferase [Hungatella hathewayi]|uniref:Acetyltransferase n=1 Tax=Hungatella hathewayi WAL-18680 TaxID=742737 RepID=G5IB43_9FIRM|nr:hypothetical protein [Hungatella hathewayi]EHI61358.1 hypothetical protein HMPREF9473_00720 [ [Hungatella hathewayi WAL-18680]